MKKPTDWNRTWDFQQLCRELAGERHKRNVLKAFLVMTKKMNLLHWTAMLSDELAASRKKINRLSAKHSRYKRRLGFEKSTAADMSRSLSSGPHVAAGEMISP